MLFALCFSRIPVADMNPTSDAALMCRHFPGFPVLRQTTKSAFPQRYGESLSGRELVTPAFAVPIPIQDLFIG
jgi:hypothetical protein